MWTRAVSVLALSLKSVRRETDEYSAVYVTWETWFWEERIWTALYPQQWIQWTSAAFFLVLLHFFTWSWGDISLSQIIWSAIDFVDPDWCVCWVLAGGESCAEWLGTFLWRLYKVLKVGCLWLWKLTVLSEMIERERKKNLCMHSQGSVSIRLMLVWFGLCMCELYKSECMWRLFFRLNIFEGSRMPLPGCLHL